MEGQQADAVLADKGYDTNAIRAFLAAVGIQAVIPSRPNRKEPIPHDKEPCKEPNLIERCFGLGFLLPAASLLWFPS